MGHNGCYIMILSGFSGFLHRYPHIYREKKNYQKWLLLMVIVIIYCWVTVTVYTWWCEHFEIKIRENNSRKERRLKVHKSTAAKPTTCLRACPMLRASSNLSPTSNTLYPWASISWISCESQPQQPQNMLNTSPNGSPTILI